MTLQEKIIVSAYTGYLMCDFSHVHKYIEEKMGRPVWTHEMAAGSFFEEIQKRAKPDFLKLCAKERREILTQRRRDAECAEGEAKL